MASPTPLPARAANAGRARPALALLVDNLIDGFENRIWDGVVEAAQAADVDLFCFLGGNLEPRPTARGAVFDLVTPARIDAAVAIFSSLGCYTPPEVSAAFVRRLAPVPVVSVGLALPGVPSLCVDNETGMGELLDHLAGVHGRRRIAFVRGPAVNAEAEARFRAYRAGLARHGLPYDPALVFPGRFDRDSGRRAAEALLSAPGGPPDALVAANDDMAIYAQKALQARGHSVPVDVAVTGFDDVLAAGAVFPALTTVRQPLRSLGEAAVRAALGMLSGAPVPELTMLRTELVVRRSCGCGPRSSAPVLSPGEEGGPLEAAPLAAAVAGRLPDVVRRLGAGSLEPLAAALLQALAGSGRPGAVLAELEGLAARGVAQRLAPDAWRPAVDLLLAEARRRGAPAAPLAALEQEVASTLAVLDRQAETVLRIKADEEAKILRRVSPPTPVSLPELEHALQVELPLLGVRSFFLCRHDAGRPGVATLAARYDPDGAVALGDPLAPFPAAQLVPGALAPDRRHAYAVLPIYSREAWLGHALCQLGPMELIGYEVLADQLGTRLRVGALMAAVQRHSAELEARVEERTRELRELHARLVDTAHRAGMAEIAIGVLHNVGNLLNSVNVSADRIGEVAERLGADPLQRITALLDAHRADLPGFFARDPRGPLVPEYLRRLGEALEAERQRLRGEARELTARTGLIRETVRGLQEHARGERGAQPPEPIALAALAEDALRIQEPALVRHRVAVTRDFLSGVRVQAQRARLVHVLVNLIKNAVEAMRATPGDRPLAVEITRHQGRALVRVRDGGEGIRPEHLPRLFTYGFTTKPDGHGFGLHSCREHLAALGGTLTAESAGPGRGATFTVSLPELIGAAGSD